MPCEITHGPGSVFAVWGKPTKEDITLVYDEIKRAADRSGRQVVYVTRVPTDAPAPDEEVRKFLKANLAGMIRLCSSYHVIMEGEGFVAAFKRGVLLSLLQPIWKKKVFYVHARADEVGPALEGAERMAAEDALARAKRLGFLDCKAPTTMLARTAS